MWDDEAGYDYDDPKHPTYRERMYGFVDNLRKKEKEDDVPYTDGDGTLHPRSS